MTCGPSRALLLMTDQTTHNCAERRFYRLDDLRVNTNVSGRLSHMAKAGDINTLYTSCRCPTGQTSANDINTLNTSCSCPAGLTSVRKIEGCPYISTYVLISFHHTKFVCIRLSLEQNDSNPNLQWSAVRMKCLKSTPKADKFGVVE
jgi:hypothetical protein